MKVHRGEPKHPGCIRFHLGTLSRSKQTQEVYFERDIVRWYGISVRNVFFGIIVTGDSREVWA